MLGIEKPSYEDLPIAVLSNEVDFSPKSLVSTNVPVISCRQKLDSFVTAEVLTSSRVSVNRSKPISLAVNDKSVVGAKALDSVG